MGALFVGAAPIRKTRVEDSARIGGLEAWVHGGTLSVYPLVMYRAWGSAAVVSQIYFAIGLVSLFTALMVSALARRFPRRAIYLFASGVYGAAAVAGALGGQWVTLAVLLSVMAAAISFVCFSAKTDFSIGAEIRNGFNFLLV